MHLDTTSDRFEPHHKQVLPKACIYIFHLTNIYLHIFLFICQFSMLYYIFAVQTQNLIRTLIQKTTLKDIYFFLPDFEEFYGSLRGAD